MGGPDVDGGRDHPEPAGVPDVPVPGHGRPRVRAHVALQLQPARPVRDAGACPRTRARERSPRERAEAIIQQVRAAGRTLLTEVESKQVLAAYGIPIVRDARRGHARTRRWPCAARDRLPGRAEAPLGDDHPQDRRRRRAAQPAATRPPSGGLSARSPTAVRERLGDGHFLGVTVQPMVALDGYELIVGSSLDPQFGPVLLFGSGGQLVEVLPGPRARPAAAQHDAGAAA